MYTSAHPRAEEALQSLAETIGDWLQEKPHLRITAASGRLFVNDAPVTGSSLRFTALHRQLEERRILGIFIQRGVQSSDLLILLEILATNPERLEELGGASQVLASRNARNIALDQGLRSPEAGNLGPDSTRPWEGPWTPAPQAGREAQGHDGPGMPEAMRAASVEQETMPAAPQEGSPEHCPPQPEASRHRLEWDSRPLDEQIWKARDSTQFWDLSQEQRIAFLEALLRQERLDPFLECIERLLVALTEEEPGLRMTAALSLARVAQWTLDPGFPMEAEGTILEGLKAHFAWESQEYIQGITAKGLEAMLAASLRKGGVGQVQRTVQDLRGLLAFLGEDQAWRWSTLENLSWRLATPEFLDPAVEALHQADADAVLAEYVPYFESLGEAGAVALVRMLGSEPDRLRRKKLLEVIRALGPHAIDALLASLKDPAWFLVRNTLNLLSEIGHAGILDEVSTCLRHADVRVKRAAVRALWKLGGPACAPFLLPDLPMVDPSTQMEILFGLGKVQAEDAVPALVDLMKRSETSEGVRVKAAEALGQIGKPAAVLPLGDLVRRKGRLFGSMESLELRLAAARALVAIGTPAALEILHRVVDGEPEGVERDALRQVLSSSSALPIALMPGRRNGLRRDL
jgi:HEAT repeat protein